MTKTKLDAATESKFAEFRVTVSLWTAEGADVATHPEKVRFVFGEALDALGLQEEVDYTLEVQRVHDYKGRLKPRMTCQPSKNKS